MTVIQQRKWMEIAVIVISALTLLVSNGILSNKNAYRKLISVVPPYIRDIQFFCEAVVLGALIVYGWWFCAVCFGIYVATRAKLLYSC